MEKAEKKRFEIGDTVQFGTKASPLTQAPFSSDSYLKKIALLLI